MLNIKFDLDDIVLVPAEKSDINSRKECNIYYDGNLLFKFNKRKLPLMASPMDTVVSKKNYEKFISLGIIPCMPRNIFATGFLSFLNKNEYFQSFGLCEIEQQLHSKEICANHFSNFTNVLIDIANGHMDKLINIVKEIKEKYPQINLMVGNVANPETFINLGLAGASLVRCSIGTGAGCTTAANVSINYPLGSLISECYELRKQYNINTKIVADGGMRNYSDIIKALALGADFVMIGSLFNKSIESAGFSYLYGIKINDKIAEILWKYNFPIKKKYRGMSTKAVQKSWGKTELVTSEGIIKYQKVEYTLSQWVENFKDYLRSAMSYCNAKTLNDFIGKANYVFITDSAKNRFLK